MSFQKGHKGFGQSRKGIPNKKTQMTLDLLKNKNFDPLEKSILIYKRAWRLSKNGHPDDRPTYLGIAASQIKELMQYVYPKRRATELTVIDESRIKEIERLKALSEAELLKEIEMELREKKMQVIEVRSERLDHKIDN